MRTTVTLDPDVVHLVQARMRAEGMTFKAALNAAIRDGVSGARRPQQFRTPTFAMGAERMDLTKALSTASSLEDEALVEKMERGA